MTEHDGASMCQPERLVAFLLHRCGCILRRRLDETLDPLGLTVRHYGILATVSLRGPLTQHAIAESLGVDPATMVGLVDELERMELLVRGQHPGDRRAHAVSLTAPGRRLLRKAERLVAVETERFLKPLPGAEQRDLHRMLARLLAGAEETARSPAGAVLRGIAVALIVTTAAGCNRGEGGQQAGGFSMPPTPVEVTVVRPQEVTERFTAVGTVEAGEAVELAAEVDGAVTELPFLEGVEVASGAVIARLDDRERRATMERARAVVAQLRSNHERVRKMAEQHLSSERDLEEASTALQVAEADLALAEARLAKTVIAAPWRGITGARRVSPGAYLGAGDVITDLAQIDEVKVSFTAPERFAGRLRRGQEVRVSVNAYPGESLPGRIDVIEPQLDLATRNLRILARVSNPQRRLRPGMSAEVAVILERRENALTVPSEAVFAEGDLFLVYTVNPDSTVARVALTLGTRLPGAVEVMSGLEPGARVVRAGHQKLFPGARVAPIESAS